MNSVCLYAQCKIYSTKNICNRFLLYADSESPQHDVKLGLGLNCLYARYIHARTRPNAATGPSACATIGEYFVYN